MKIKFKRIADMRFVTTGGQVLQLTTVGFWAWSQPENKGTLLIQSAKMSDWRFELAVFGHECIEALYCWVLGITTEQCDAFDLFYEQEYAAGRIDPSCEAGHDPKCPYHWGHMAGVVWEYLVIYCTFAGWKQYESDCNRIMGID